MAPISLAQMSARARARERACCGVRAPGARTPCASHLHVLLQHEVKGREQGVLKLAQVGGVGRHAVPGLGGSRGVGGGWGVQGLVGGRGGGFRWTTPARIDSPPHVQERPRSHPRSAAAPRAPDEGGDALEEVVVEPRGARVLAHLHKHARQRLGGGGGGGGGSGRARWDGWSGGGSREPGCGAAPGTATALGQLQDGSLRPQQSCRQPACAGLAPPAHTYARLLPWQRLLRSIPQRPAAALRAPTCRQMGATGEMPAPRWPMSRITARIRYSFSPLGAGARGVGIELSRVGSRGELVGRGGATFRTGRVPQPWCALPPNVKEQVLLPSGAPRPHARTSLGA